MAYEKQVWRNGDPTTPLSDDRLNHMEEGIANSGGTRITEDPENPGLYLIEGGA